MSRFPITVVMLLAAIAIATWWFSMDDADPELTAPDSRLPLVGTLPHGQAGNPAAAGVSPRNDGDARQQSEDPDSTNDSADEWMDELLQEARAGNAEAITRVIFGLANENSPLHDYLRARTSTEEMTELLRSRIAMGDTDALLNAAGLLFSQADLEGLQLPGIYAVDIEYALLAASRNGNNEAAMMLGLLKLQDFSTTGNEQARDEALALYHRLGEAGDPEALAALAYLHAGEDKFGVKRDPEQLRHWLEKLVEVADAGQASSVASSLLRSTRQPNPEPLEFEMGIRLLAKAGREGNEHALNEAAWILATCNGPEPAQFRHAETYIREHIERNGADAESMNTLAAVQARQGNFAAAMASQLEAIRLLEAQAIIPESPTYQAFYARLNEYQNGQAVNDEEYCPE